jgi:hypothetical protein
MVSIERSHVIAASQQFGFLLAGVCDVPLPRRTHRQFDAVHGVARQDEPQPVYADLDTHRATAYPHPTTGVG